MNALVARLMLGAALAGVVGLAVAYPHSALSPAALIKGHGELEADCLACHKLGSGVPESRCVGCHAVDGIGLRTSKGQPLARASGKVSFHQRLWTTKCLACHTEHPGSAADKARAGFSHTMLAPADRGDCGSCHARPADELHRGSVAGCGTCHTTEAWKPATFDHRKYFLLDRDHDVSCATCHPGNVFAKYTCYGCHEHTEAGMARKHTKDGIREFANCVQCHRTPNEHDAKGGREGSGGGEGGRDRGKERDRERDDDD